MSLLRTSCLPAFASAKRFALLVVLVMGLASLALPSAVFGDPTVKIGVLAYRGDEQAMAMWSPTAAYLNASVPEYSFSIVPLDFHEISPAVSRGDIDFVLANTSIYVELEARYGVSRIATLKNRGRNGGYTIFGGVILCRADRADINGLGDLRGKTFMAVDDTSLGGWQVAWRELKDQGIDPYDDFKSLQFGNTHDAVVYAVLDGTADAGTVRTDTIERMAEVGRIDLDKLRVLNPQRVPGFPFALSTRVYPEWPFARLRRTNDELAQKVVIALLQLPADSPAAKAAKITGWTVPLDYEPVHALLKELRLGPYKEYGRITLAAAVRQYWRWVVLTLLALLSMVVATAYVVRLNRRLAQAHRLLEEASGNLVEQVQERTADLRLANEGLSREIGQHKEAEERLVKSEEFIRNILNSVDDGFIVVDRDYRILTANTAYCNQLGRSRSEVIGGRCHELSHRMDRPCAEAGGVCAVQSVFETGQPHSVVHTHVTPTGELAYVENKAYPLRDGDGRVTSAIEVISDITEKRLLEEERLKTQKLQSIGTLAGGIAHDFNNLLQGVLGYISIAKLAAGQREKSVAALENAEKALRLSVKLTNQLLTFAKGGKPVKRPIAPLPVIENAVKFALSGSHTDSRVTADDDLMMIDADEGQIGQVVQNIAMNAGQAMPEGGRVEIIARNVCAPASDLPQNLRPGPYVEIAIKDSGIGIPEQDLSRIFDPYFTTKEKGSGLGLATSYSIMANHDGMIEVRSEVGRGTVFLLYVPARGPEPGGEHAGKAEEGPAERGARRRILVMDDEPVIRDVARELLAELGHDAEFAGHGAEAIEKFRAAQRSGRPFDAVILDLTIRGGMGGAETLRGLREIDPAVRAIVSSGYSDDAAIAEHRKQGFQAFLRKPYAHDTLRDTLTSVFGAS
ncbi:MAG: PhnD/SsuA/transferrin family substrate-binding protein [Nitrospirota bacterium]